MKPVGDPIFLGLFLFLLSGIGNAPRRARAASRVSNEFNQSKSETFIYPAAHHIPRHIPGDGPGNSSYDTTTSGGVNGSNKRKLFIHIGPYKTGTTYFHTWIKQLGGISDDLRYLEPCTHLVTERRANRVWYAQYADKVCELGKWPNGHRWPCVSDSENLIGASHMLPEGKDVIVSSERFSKCGAEGFRAIHKELNDTFDVYVVGVRRDPRTMFMSRFHQTHKEFEKPDRIWDIITQGDTRGGLCTYLSAACVEVLAREFGPDRVVTVSYEGMKAAGKDLADVLCEELSTSPPDCYVPPANLTIETNTSPPHIMYSALTIYSKLRAFIGCNDNLLFAALAQKAQHIERQAGYDAGAHATSAARSRNALQAWQQALADAGVHQNCLPITSLHPRAQALNDSDANFFWLARQGQLPGRHLYYEEGEAYEESTDICEFDEAAVWQSQEVLERLITVVRELASCSGK